MKKDRECPKCRGRNTFVGVSHVKEIYDITVEPPELKDREHDKQTYECTACGHSVPVGRKEWW